MFSCFLAFIVLEVKIGGFTGLAGVERKHLEGEGTLFPEARAVEEVEEGRSAYEKVLNKLHEAGVTLQSMSYERRNVCVLKEHVPPPYFSREYNLLTDSP